MTTISDYLDKLAKSYTSKPTGWAILKNPPTFKFRQPAPIFYKDSDGNRYFILTPGPKNNTKNQKLSKSRMRSKKNERYKYNITLDKYISVQKVKFSSLSASFSHVIHSKENRLYVIGEFCALFDLQKNEWTMHSCDHHLKKARICYVNNSIHIISNNQTHYMLDSDTHKLKTVTSLSHKFREIQSMIE